MNEVLTKRFWQDLKKTFYDALEGPPAGDRAPEIPAAGKPETPAASESTASPATPPREM